MKINVILTKYQTKFNHIKTLILPYENKYDIDEVPNEIRNELQFYPVTNYMDIYQYLFKK